MAKVPGSILMRKGLWYRFAAWLVRTFVFPLAGGLTVIGKENVPKEGALVVASVHLSHLDPPLLGSTCPRELRFMAKEELFKNPLLGGLIKSLGAFPVKRGTSDMAAIKLAIQWLQEGRAVLVFPEGQRGDGTHLQPLQSGAHLLAKRSGAMIVPVGIAGTHKVMPRGSKGIHRARTTVVYGKPFLLSEVPEDSKEAFANFLGTRLVEACRAAGLELKLATQ